LQRQITVKAAARYCNSGMSQHYESVCAANISALAPPRAILVILLHTLTVLVMCTLRLGRATVGGACSEACDLMCAVLCLQAIQRTMTGLGSYMGEHSPPSRQQPRWKRQCYLLASLGVVTAATQQQLLRAAAAALQGFAQ
jgi:hypothetical protein